MHAPDFLYQSARRHGETEAVWDGQRRRSYTELLDRSRRIAAGLLALGLEPGQRIALLATNRVEFVELTFASAMAGTVLVPINGRLRAAEVLFQIEDADAACIVVEDSLRELVADAPENVRRVVLGGAVGDPPGQNAIDFETLVHEEPIARRAAAPDDVLVQMYTSGTTGQPKGAMLTHRNVVSMVLAWLYEIGLKEAPDRFLLVMPLFHVGGLLHTMSCVAAGAHLRLVHEFLPAPILDTLIDERVTHVLFVPAMVQWLLQEKDVDERRFGDLRRIIYGGAPMPEPVLRRALEVFGCEFVQGYGLTETTGVVTVLRPNDHAADDAGELPRLTSAGRAVMTCAVRVVDASGVDVAPGTVGEVVARGEQITPGYWQRPQATAASFRDGWFKTGDLATIDAEGYVTIVDRLKDMILVAGENVYPSEVEAVLASHPAVHMCTVVGIPHDTWGEEVLAIVVLEPLRGDDEGDERTETANVSNELIRHCRGQLARFKCPTRVEIRDELPRNAGGKVLKRELRAAYWDERERSV